MSANHSSSIGGNLQRKQRFPKVFNEALDKALVETTENVGEMNSKNCEYE